jgi:Ca2+-binding EF-hand superfamily protein
MKTFKQFIAEAISKENLEKIRLARQKRGKSLATDLVNAFNNRNIRNIANEKQFSVASNFVDQNNKSRLPKGAYKKFDKEKNEWVTVLPKR